MDSLIDFVCELPEERSTGLQQTIIHGEFELRLATAADVNSLAEVVRASFADHFGRFHSDRRIGREQATRIDEAWIRSCASGWANWIIVAVQVARNAGYSAWKNLLLWICGTISASRIIALLEFIRTSSARGFLQL
jgi:hypothetical protein